MKFYSKIVIIGIILLTLLVTIFTFISSKEARGNPQRGVRDMIREKLFYTIYKNNKFQFSFKYPKDWELKEYHFKPNRNNQADPHGMGMSVNILRPIGPKEGPLELSLYIVPTKETGSGFSTVDEYAAFTIKGRGTQKTKMLSDIKTTLAGLKAREITILYDTLIPRRLQAAGPTKEGRVVEEWVIIKKQKRWIIIEKDGYFYDLQFEANKDDYSKYIKVYEDAKETFNFVK